MLMKNFTLLMTLLLSVPCVAQGRFSLKSVATKSPIVTKAENFKSKRNRVKTFALNARTQAEANAIMLPRQEEEWVYEEEWYQEGNYFYEHDNRGNITKNSYDDGFAVSATDYTYDENNNKLTQIESYSEEGEPFENSSKREWTYDSKVTDLVVESKSYSWEETDWTLVSDGYTYKRVITRNDKGAITSVEVYSYFMNEYHLQHRATITYNADGLAETWKYEELGYDGTGYVMNEIYTLTEMQWYTTDGQILVLSDLSDFFTGNRNRLKKATVYSEGELSGYIEASYEESGNYTYKYVYTSEPYAEEIYTHTVTDGNGSYDESCVAYEDMDEDGAVTEAELALSETLTVKKDKYGRVIEESATADEEVMFAAKYDFTYSEEYGSYPVEQVYSEYDFGTEEYIPFLKIVAKDFYDVTSQSSIENVEVNANAPVEYYNLQGVKVSNPENGIFIKKQGAKTTKVVL